MTKFKKITGIYNAEGSLTGEIKYFFRKIMGTTSCSLCDISHQVVIEKPEFKILKNQMPNLQMQHLDEINEDIAQLVEGKTPCVVALQNEQWQIILDKDELANCHGKVEAFSRLLLQALAR